MSGDKRKRADQDLEGLDPAEREALGAVVDRLRADRSDPGAAHFFDGLQQRIASQVAVTPLPRRRRGWAARLSAVGAFLASGPRRWALAGVAVAAIVAAVLLFGGASEQAPVRGLPTPGQLAVVREREAVPREDDPLPRENDELTGPPAMAVSIPDDLWSDGFLSHGALYDDDLDVEALAPSDAEAAEALESDELTDLSLALETDLLAEPDALESMDYDWGGWALDDLTDAELADLEALLGG